MNLLKNVESYDVIVVGAGPAGSSSAIFLRKQGLSVLLLDKAKFPRDKVCGDGLGPRTFPILRQLGVFDRIESASNFRGNSAAIYSSDEMLFEVNFDKLGVGSWELGESKIRTQYSELNTPNSELNTPNYQRSEKYDDFFLTIERSELDRILVSRAVELGVTFIDGLKVENVYYMDGRVGGVLGRKDGQCVSFHSKLVIGADGANSLVGRRIGNHPITPSRCFIGVRSRFKGVCGLTDRVEGFYHPEILPGFAWLFPLGGDQANIGLGIRYDCLNKRWRSPREAFNHLIKTNNTLKERLREAEPIDKVKSWLLPTYAQSRKNYTHGAILVGDAASLIDPLSGEGITYALTSGKIASQVASQAFLKKNFSAKSLSLIDGLYRSQIGPWLRSPSFLLRVPRVSDGMIAAARRAKRDPHFAGILGGMAAGVVPKGKLISLDFFRNTILPFWGEEIKKKLSNS